MSTPYSYRFFLGLVPSTGDSDVFTVPVGKLAIVQDLDALAESGSGEILLLSVEVGSATVVPISLEQLTAGVSVKWAGKMVLNAGDKLALTPTSSAWWVQISGALLDNG